MSRTTGDRAALFVGGDWHRKGRQDAIDALAEAAGRRLLVVGEGDRAAMSRRINASRLDARVTFLGGVGDPRPAV